MVKIGNATRNDINGNKWENVLYMRYLILLVTFPLLLLVVNLMLIISIFTKLVFGQAGLEKLTNFYKRQHAKLEMRKC